MIFWGVLLLTSIGFGSDGKDTYLAHSSKPQFDGMYVAFVVTALRGKELDNKLPERLQQLCAQNNMLDHYRISVYTEKRYADLAREIIGRVPNLNDPDGQAVERATLARYSPDEGDLFLMPGANGSRERRIALGNKWCRGKEAGPK